MCLDFALPEHRKSPVGASLLAKAVGQLASKLDVPTSSRASSLPQLIAQPRLATGCFCGEGACSRSTAQQSPSVSGWKENVGLLRSPAGASSLATTAVSSQQSAVSSQQSAD
ncbi:hypothetical protein FHK92_19695 [Pseudomonas brassicacearum subsp. neoaurantiaca]|uniref:Uncharacterized protein n=1 Tax=Pseudomonas brassicacearum subsp. neoaurantiaca TaxID=494916 RepID=A0A7V8ZUD7_9PSED|nr:hypothetical protein [Pseudomonas brassicacearum subsp. neoaurantiaca]